MRRGWLLGTIPLTSLLLATAGPAQDDKSTGQPGQGVPSGFRSFIVVDDRFPPKVDPNTKGTTRDPRDRTAMMHDLIVEQGLNPVAAVFTRNDPTKAVHPAVARLVEELDPLVQKHRANNFGAFLIFLTLDQEYPKYTARNPDGTFLREIQADAVRGFAAQVKTPRVAFGLAARQSDQTAAWGIAENDELVVVLYDRMRVVNRWSFKVGSPPGEEQVKEILDAAAKLAGGK